MAKLGAVRYRALATALAEVGTKEVPSGSNWGPRVSQYLKSVGISFPAAWCLAFVHWCYHRNGYELAGYGLVQSFVNWATKNGAIVARPFKGDIVCYDWNSDRWHDHVGIVVKVLALRWRGKAFAGWVKTVEGNTSPDARGSQSNGDGVYIRYRWVKSCKFARVKGNGE